MKKTITFIALIASLSTTIAQTLNFINKSNKPIARSASASASNGDDLYIANGFSANNLETSEIEKYNFSTDTWSVFQTAIPTILKKYGNAEILSNNLYLFNGETTLGSGNNKLEIIDLATGNLTLNAISNPNPVINSGSAVSGDKFFVFGGCINKFNANYSNKLYQLSPIGTWESLADMPVAMETKGKVIYGNGNNSKLYVFGGYNETNLQAENFESVNITGNLSLSNWLNIAESGIKLFQGKLFGENKYAQISAFGSVINAQEPSNIAWLISDEITTTSTNNLFLNFDTKDGFNNGAVLEAYIVTNWTGDIATATKTLLNATISDAANTSGFATYFTNSGTIPLAGFPTNFRVAFKYTGGYAPVQRTTTFQVDNVRVYRGFSSNAIYVYDVASNTWSTSSTSLPQPISAHSVAVENLFNGTKIYVTGDYNNQTFVGVFDSNENTFETLNQTNMIGRRHHNTEIWNDILYLFGGNTTPSISSVLASTQSSNLPQLANENFILKTDIVFYPNPANEKIQVQEDIILACIYTLDGKKMNVQLKDNEVNISSLANGVYLFEGLNKNGAKVSKKLIKK